MSDQSRLSCHHRCLLAFWQWKTSTGACSQLPWSNSATQAAELRCPAGAQVRLDSLSTWLAAHAAVAVAGVTSLAASYHSYEDNWSKAQLQLPFEQLQNLQSLQLGSLTVTGRPSTSEHTSEVSTGPAAGLPPAALSALQSLTSLDVAYCQMQLQGLSAVSTLQRLVWYDSWLDSREDAGHYGNWRALCEALPCLHGLTSVDLRGAMTNRATVRALAGLPALQELQLCSVFPPRTLEQLPQALTCLWLDGSTQYSYHKPLFSTSTAPGVTKLTALQDLTLRSATVSVDLLAQLTVLKRLDLWSVSMTGPSGLSVLGLLTGLTYLDFGIDKISSLAGPSSLSWLAALTRLEHLKLPYSYTDKLLQEPADIAAVTASSQLTFLDICCSFRTYGQHADLFPADRQLPNLAELHVSLDMVSDGASGAAAAACCPNLQRLKLHGSSMASEFDVQEGAEQDDQVHALSALMRSLQQLQHLTSLEFEGRWMALSTPVWSAFGRLTQLHKLVAEFARIEYTAGVLHLSGCCRLTELCVGGLNTYDGEMLGVHLVEEAAPDGTTTIHKRLVPALQTAIVEDLEDITRYPGLLKTLLSVSATAQQEQQKQVQQLHELCMQQHQQILQLQQQVASLQAAANQQVDLQQQVAGLGAAVALLQQQMSQGAGPVVAPQ